MRFFVFLLLLMAIPCHAQMIVDAPTTDALLIKLLTTEELDNAQFITEFIPRVQQTINLAQETLKTSNRLYELGKSLAEYGPETLLGKMKEQFCAGFSGACPLIDRAVKEIRGLSEIADLGKGQFFAYKKSLSGDAGRFISGLAAGMVKARRHPTIAAAMNKYAGTGISAVDEIFTAALAKKGMAQDLILKAVEATSVQAAVKTFLDEANRTSSLTAQGIGVQLGIEQAQARDLETLANIEKANFVRKEVEEELTRQGQVRFLDAYRKRIEEMKKNKELRKLLETGTVK